MTLHTRLLLVLTLLCILGACPRATPEPDEPDPCSEQDDGCVDDDDSAADDDDSAADDDDVADDDDSGVEPCDPATDPTCDVPPAPTLQSGDYAHWYWPGNHRPVETWPVVEPVMHFLTGHYGLVFDESTGDLSRFGALEDGLDASAAQHRPNSDIEELAQASIRFEAGAAEAPVLATTFEGNSPGAVDRVRMIDGGRFMNRVEVPNVLYENGGLSGRVEIASMPRHVVFTHTVEGGEDSGTARVVLSGAAVQGLATVTEVVPDRALTVTDASGAGWLFVVYDAAGSTSTLSRSADGEIVAERTTLGAASAGVTVSLLAAPTTALGDAELAMYTDPTTVEVGYTLLDETGSDVSATVPAPWEPTLGAYLLPLGSLQEAGGPWPPDWNDPSLHHWYGRHRIEVTPSSGATAVPLAMHGSDRISWYVVGGAPLLRSEEGEPLGVPVQISKNWHGEYWYHLYAQAMFPEATTLELTVASSKWGDAYAASHAQLSLVGWNDAGGHWDESALGCFGESVTYDPDLALGRAMVDDVRPFLVQSNNLWDWTGNVGGADFLRYTTAAEPYWQRRLARVRSQYAASGPNLTDVTYSGVSTDGRIQADVRVRMGATDDLVRVWYDLDYTFLEDVSYDRLAFFQVAADNYSDNGFARYAAGNADGVLFDEAVPDHGTTGYAGNTDRGIPLEGASPWVMLYDNQRDWDSLPEHYADVGFVIRSFQADIGGTVLTTPHVNLQRTFNQQMSQVAVELGLPHEDGSPWCGAPCGGQTRFVPAGSTVSATVEYLVPPADKDRYYGLADWLLALPAGSYRTPEMMRTAAVENALEVTVSVGTLASVYPVEVAATSASLAADLTLSGGVGFVPITFTGLNRHDGWRLETESGNGWVPVNQATRGNDFWQAVHDPDAGTWSLTFNVPNRGTQRYRLTWGAG